MKNKNILIQFFIEVSKSKLKIYYDNGYLLRVFAYVVLFYLQP